MTLRRLVGEVQTPNPINGVHYGYSLYLRDDRGYAMVARSRVYDGIRVASRWDSEVILLEARVKGAAEIEAVDKMRALIRSLSGVET